MSTPPTRIEIPAIQIVEGDEFFDVTGRLCRAIEDAEDKNGMVYVNCEGVFSLPFFASMTARFRWDVKVLVYRVEVI